MIVIYGLMIFAIFLFEMKRSKRAFVDFLSIFHLFFLFSYVTPAFLFLLDNSLQVNWRYLSLHAEAVSSLTVLSVIIIGYVSVVLGYALAVKAPKQIYPELAFRYGEKSQLLIVIIFFFISFFSFVLYSYGHGGVLDLVLSGKEIRTSRQHAGVLQYLSYFAEGLTLSVLMFYSLVLFSDDRSVMKRSKKFLIGAFICALLYAVGTAGRAKIGYVFLFLFLLHFLSFKPRLKPSTILFFLIFGAFIYLLIVYGKSAIWTLGSLKEGPFVYLEALASHRARYEQDGSGGGLVQNLAVLVSQQDHHLASLYAVLYYPEAYQFPRLIWDWPRALLEVMPGINKPEFVVSNTPSGLGRIFFEARGYVPPGWIAMKLMNGGPFWLALGGGLVGYIGGYLNTFLLMNWKKAPLVPGLFIYMAFFWNNYIVGPDPFMVILSNVSTMLFALLVTCLASLKTVRPLKSYDQKTN